VKRYIDGLLRECELLSAEITRLSSEREYVVGTNIETVDITDAWRTYLHWLLSTKLALVSNLQARSLQLGGEAASGPASGNFRCRATPNRALGNPTATSE
jgi:hypothetical protein